MTIQPPLIFDLALVCHRETRGKLRVRIPPDTALHGSAFEASTRSTEALSLRPTTKYRGRHQPASQRGAQSGITSVTSPGP